jgi:hypothetical protein
MLNNRLSLANHRTFASSNRTNNQNMMHSKNKISGEVNTLSLVVREYIVRHCVTITAYVPDWSKSISKDKQVQAENKNNAPIPKRA